ncbi:unnamed protein product [Brassicogethes aeneus]|uniref:Elongation of very long chain fatty acids protein n=1 Tax=Brassicogethes aeneus TaxID=1431903 RepID=A0A9P0B4G3_BRAAE|nr:unnamed protein product [Brassicogethes aeneus]
MTSNNETSSYWDYLFTELADHRTSNWFLLKDPVPGLTILVTYLFFVLKWGPAYMKDRKPFDLRKVLIAYNFVQVICSSWLLYEALDGAWLHYSWKCQPVDFSETPEAMRVARGVYIYFLTKVTELLDTIFFVLRKNERQITFLHLYHHAGMMAISWGVAKYYPGGHGTFVGMINCFIQFCIAFIHNGQLLFYSCGYPRWSVVFTLPNSIFFYYLFADFYKKTYKGEVKGSNGMDKKVH